MSQASAKDLVDRWQASSDPGLLAVQSDKCLLAKVIPVERQFTGLHALPVGRESGRAGSVLRARLQPLILPAL